MTNLLLGTYKGRTYRMKVDCYPKTAEIKLTLLSRDRHEEFALTQNIGQGMPSYQAFLGNGLLELNNSEFMDYMEQNDLGYIADYKRFDTDVFTGRPRRVVAVFQFNKSRLHQLDPQGCDQYDKRYYKLLSQQKKTVSLYVPACIGL